MSKVAGARELFFDPPSAFVLARGRLLPPTGTSPSLKARTCSAKTQPKAYKGSSWINFRSPLRRFYRGFNDIRFRVNLSKGSANSAPPEMVRQRVNRVSSLKELRATDTVDTGRGLSKEKEIELDVFIRSAEKNYRGRLEKLKRSNPELYKKVIGGSELSTKELFELSGAGRVFVTRRRNP